MVHFFFVHMYTYNVCFVIMLGICKKFNNIHFVGLTKFIFRIFQVNINDLKNKIINKC